MLDWKKITEAAKAARTLDGAARAEFLASACNDPEQREAASRLLERTAPDTAFMRTSMPEPAEETATLVEGQLVGPWRIERLIGRGGMGEVYRAARADGLYEQTVALKLVQGTSAERAATFDTERRRLAMMEHPGIARIVDGGTTDDGVPYMAMEYVDGRPINQHVNAHQLPRADVLRMFLSVCSAVAHAHSRLILHRDIKAENVLVAEDGDPRLIDFGIAMRLASDGLRGGPLTLATAAPEQLMGAPLSVQTDVFSLGVLLHELVTGERPQRLANGGMAVAMADIKNSELSAILTKALAAAPDRRYASVEELHDEVTALLEHRPVAARAGGRWYSARKFLQRNPLVSGFAAVAVLSLLAGLGVSLKFAADARAEARRAVAKQLEAEDNLKRSEYFHERSVMFQGIQRTYSSLQQAMYGGDADVERQTRIFLERWREAHAKSDQEPDQASQISYAVGRHFLFRNDYPTAIEVLSGWVEKGYGPEDLHLAGQHLLAIAYTNAGRAQEALPLLRKVEAWRASTYEQGLADHIATATQIADITRAPEDIEKAEKLLLNGIENHDGAYVIAYYLQRLAVLREMRGDFPGALEARRQEMEVVEQELQLSVENSDTARMGLARFELLLEGNTVRASQLLDEVIAWSRKVKGESRVLGQAYLYKALVLAAKGERDQALELMEASVALMVRFSGPTSDASLTSQMYLAELLAESDAPRALEVLANIHAAVEESDSKMVAQRYRLAELLVGHLAGAAPPEEVGTASIDFELCRTNLGLDHALRKLVGLGLVQRPERSIYSNNERTARP